MEIDKFSELYDIVRLLTSSLTRNPSFTVPNISLLKQRAQAVYADEDDVFNEIVALANEVEQATSTSLLSAMSPFSLIHLPKKGRRDRGRRGFFPFQIC